MPYETWGCRICGKQAPKRLREHGTFSERMKWLWSHRKKYHPKEHARSIRKSLEARGLKPKRKGKR
jgi:hypothetical protein